MYGAAYGSEKAQSLAQLEMAQTNQQQKNFSPTIINASRDAKSGDLDLRSVQTPSNELIQTATQRATDEISASAAVAWGGSQASATLSKSQEENAAAGLPSLAGLISSPLLVAVLAPMILAGLVYLVRRKK